MADLFDTCAKCLYQRRPWTEYPCKTCYVNKCETGWKPLDPTRVAAEIAERYGAALVAVETGTEEFTCHRCHTTALPLVAYLNTSAQPHYAAAFCSWCIDTAVFIRWLRKPENERQRPTMSPSLRWDIMERDGHRCTYCGRHVSNLDPGEYLHVDHKVPVSRGGSSEPDNLCCSCSTCNLGKSDKQPA